MRCSGFARLARAPFDTRLLQLAYKTKTCWLTDGMGDMHERVESVQSQAGVLIKLWMKL
jgi:hypothetical protein